MQEGKQDIANVAFFVKMTKIPSVSSPLKHIHKLVLILIVCVMYSFILLVYINLFYRTVEDTDQTRGRLWVITPCIQAIIIYSILYLAQ